MSTLFALIFILSIGFLIWGIISPGSMSRFGKKPITRKDAVLGFGALAFVAMILTGVTAPDLASQQTVAPADQVAPVSSTVEQKEPEPIITTALKDETTEIAYTKRTVQDPSLASGTTKISTTGKNGLMTRTYEYTYSGGVETARKLIKEEVTTPATEEITLIGTKVARAAPSKNTASDCDPNYSGGCVPNVSYDLDCPDIGFRVRVVGSDPHGFDGSDNDGWGCESY